MSIFDPLPSPNNVAWTFSAALAGRATLLLRATSRTLNLRKIA
jgi:hypothetical protein